MSGILEASHDRCFYCGFTFDPRDITKEHVFPKWLQRRFSLWDDSLVLLNQTPIKYRNLIVPACHPCNTVILSRLEGAVASSLPGGAKKIRALGHDQIFVWMSKIFFGILYAEALLPVDRSNLEQGSILPDGAIQDFEHMHLLMRSAREHCEFHSFGEVPYHTSLLIFDTQEYDNDKINFMYRDDVPFACIAIRVGKVSIIYVSDGGAQERIAGETLSNLFAHQLHPLQFEEVTALTFTRTRGFNRNPLHILEGSSLRVPTRIFQTPLAGLSGKPIFDEFDKDTFANLLSTFTNIPLDVISPGDGRVMTWIGDYRQPRFIDARDHHP